jgi:nucleotide-binding universal stress UspA family protein
MELDQERNGVEAASRYGRQLELAGVPTKVELIRTLSGHVARLIVGAARDHQADMIVLGSRGRSDLTALLLGSVAHKVIHLVDRPVLAVRDGSGMACWSGLRRAVPGPDHRQPSDDPPLTRQA